jgi:hypothetical protein
MPIFKSKYPDIVIPPVTVPQLVFGAFQPKDLSKIAYIDGLNESKKLTFGEIRGLSYKVEREREEERDRGRGGGEATRLGAFQPKDLSKIAYIDGLNESKKLTFGEIRGLSYKVERERGRKG